MWIFDQSDGSARLLKQRQGHSAPPTHVKFYTAGGLGLLSAGKLRGVADWPDLPMSAENMAFQGP